VHIASSFAINMNLIEVKNEALSLGLDVCRPTMVRGLATVM